MEKDNNPKVKWEAKVSAKLDKATVDQIWPLFTDFFNFHRWFPTNIEVCYGVHGANGEPGCIRYWSGSLTSSGNGEADEKPWGKERLLAVDHAEHILTYELLENNIGHKSYVSTVKIFPADKAHDQDHPRGCVIEWSFSVDPIEGFTLDGMVAKYNEWIRQIAGKMEASLENSE
ncbi:Polyketide cyclase/dehydrase [Trema orientale]|uniref:Polyketide cyclase/dehydrase n=1 Tax=Trema orientale TaxID=63057 RepID=A0A2P5BF68_TREOI|nr:Polyketide cyclase/dehydrase [Trema orientale]